MRGQVQRLVDAACLPNVTLQILPFSAGPGGDLYPTSADQVSRYWRLFERSRALTFTPQRSIAFLAELRRNA